jgi:hypothetical protein
MVQRAGQVDDAVADGVSGVPEMVVKRGLGGLLA